MNKEAEKKKKKRKRDFKIIFLRLPLVVLLLVFLFTSVPLFIDSLGLCAICYFWVEVGEDLKENNILSNKLFIILLIIGGIYFVISLISAFFSSAYLCIMVGIGTYGYTLFKIYKLITVGIKQYNLRADYSLLVGGLGLLVGIGLYFYNITFFGVIVAILFFFFFLFDDVIRFMVEREHYKREL